MAEQEEKIMCPHCEWKPDGGAYWTCHCGCTWNTFETYGQCPDCGKNHLHTQCPSCTVWSPHPDWYVDLMNIDIKEEVFDFAKN